MSSDEALGGHEMLAAAILDAIENALMNEDRAIASDLNSILELVLRTSAHPEVASYCKT